MIGKVIRWHFAFALLALASSHALAQQIQGQVRYNDTGQPAINVTVRCDGIGGNTFQMTDASGKFFFRVSPGHYTVTVQIPGYQEQQQTADLTDANSSEYMFIKLKPDGTAKTGAATPAAAGVPEAAHKEFEEGRALILGEGGKKADVQEGLKHLEKAVSLYPKYLDAQVMLGTAYMDAKQWDKAEAALRKALEINPQAANADLALGTLYLQQKKYAEAEKALKDGLAVEDRSYQGHLTLARLYWNEALASKDEAQSRPMLEQSYKEVNQALALKPDLADAHLLRGNLLLRVHRAEDALAEFQEYLRLAPDGPFAPQARDISQKIKDALAKKP
jgi:tetratricopeptide (TPR) repeat protein